MFGNDEAVVLYFFDEIFFLRVGSGDYISKHNVIKRKKEREKEGRKER